ncbi:ricin-type beta-trefoil lectin domain protein [Streptomyces sp. NPDC007369]|uniref:RICIN domain-containing protein n=1 Tax=Streptomyces sp. NPDC007369 TaxID=3154589 RepID=UPI0033F65A7C
MKSWKIRSAMVAGLALSALLGQMVSGQAAQAAGSADIWTVKLQNYAGMCLTIENGSLRNNTPALVSDCDKGLDNQVFELVPAWGGGQNVRAKHSGRCLKISEDKQRVVQAWCSDTDDESQRWNIFESQNGRQLNSVAAPELCVWSGPGSGPARLASCAGTPAMFTFWDFTT